MGVLGVFIRENKHDAHAKACTLATCLVQNSFYNYRPSLAANVAFLVLFSLSLCGFVLQVALSRRFIGFSIALISGCIIEVLGYVGRIMSNHDPFFKPGFLMQIVCLTIAPAFIAAGLYLTLSRIVVTFGPENSRIKPLSYPRIFIPCDVASLLLQAAGGGIASAASNANKNPAVGDHIMVAGLAFQVVTLAVFICLCTDFAVRTLGRMKKMGDAALDPSHARLRASIMFRVFVAALAFATLCVFIRSVYRVVELGEGWEGALIKNQYTFIGLEGVMVIAAVLALNAFHPGFCFREGYIREQKTKVKNRKNGKFWRKTSGRGREAEEKAETGSDHS